MAWVPYDEHLRSQAQDVPLTSSTNSPDAQQSSADSQDESWAHMIGRTVKESALPVAGGVAGAALGGLMGGGVGAVPGEMLGSAAGEWLSQKLGLTQQTEGLTGMLDPGQEQILMAGALPGLGRALGVGVRGAIKATGSGRILARELAQKGLGDIEVPIVEDIANYFKAAGSSGKTVNLPISSNIGTKKFMTQLPHTFQDAADAISNLKNTMAGMASRGENTAVVNRHINLLEDLMDKQFPGWKSTMSKMESLDSITGTQKFVNSHGPLADFEQALAQGRVMGANPVVGGGRMSQIAPETQNEIRKILADLGPDPGHNAVRTLIEGRALGHVAGALFGGMAGFHEGGMVGGGLGMLAGMFIPSAMDSMLAKSMAHPTLRAFVKGAINTHGIAKPEFWAALGQLGTRLLGNGFIPQPPPPQPAMPPMPVQPQEDQGEGSK